MEILSPFVALRDHLRTGKCVFCKRALDDVPCAVKRDIHQAACGFNRQGSRAT
jgi:hypothetical protein